MLILYFYGNLNKSNNQIFNSPLLILAITCLGFSLSTVHPTERQLPKTDLTVPARFLAKDFSYKVRAIFLTCSKVKFPL
jgi:hypothetical protein